MDIEPPDQSGTPEPPMDGGAGGGSVAVEAMRQGVWARTRRWLAGPGVHRWSPRALMVMMASGAYAPLLVEGNTASALMVTGAATASVGANVMTEILQDGIEHLRGRKSSLTEVEEWLAGRFEEVLEAGGRRASVLEGEMALIFDEVGASQAALRAAVEHGDQALRAELAAGLVGLEHRFDETGAALTEAHLKLDRIHRDLGSLLEAARESAAARRTDNTLGNSRVDGVVVQVGEVRGDVTVGDRHRARSVPEPVGTSLDQVRDPFAWGVHHPVELDDPSENLGVLPAYVQREHDTRLARIVGEAMAGASRIAVLVGGSSTGKTRACWEALNLLREQTAPWRLWHPPATQLPTALAGLDRVAPYTVIWLNEAQFYLDTGTTNSGESLAAGLRDLLRDTSRGPVLILATLWPEHWTTLTTRTESDTQPHARELLAGRTITVPNAFAGKDLDTLANRTGQDPRLAEAADGAQDGQVTQYLAGVPVLLDRYDKANPATKALIHAAMDARRLGAGPELPLALLAAAAPGYLTDAEWDQTGPDWLRTGLGYLTAPCNGIPGILTPIKPGPARNRRPAPARHPRHEPDPAPGPRYRLADYLEQHGRRYRAGKIPPIAFWTAAAAHAHPSDMATLGDAAWDRGLYRDAVQLLKHATADGNPEAATDLLNHLHALHPNDRRPAAWVAANTPPHKPYSVARLLGRLRKVGADKQDTTLRANEPDDYAGMKVLSYLFEVHVGEQVTALVARDPVAHAPLDNPYAVGFLLVSLREAGADKQFTALLARDPVSHIRLDDRYAVVYLLGRLRAVGADEQVTALVQRLPAAGAFDEFMKVGDHKERFRFGREPDGTAAAPWEWDDLEQRTGR